MGSFAVGTVVLVLFPFSDLSDAKRRPALIIADSGSDDWILCQITSRPYSDSRAIRISDDDFDEGGLDRESYVRPGKLFTANGSIIAKVVGVLNQEIFRDIIEEVIDLISPTENEP
ncbi:MAG: hypothetical protein OHK0029_15090 [Armatimonadaceae bacterium]